jgi:hypothetical protein
MVHAMERWELGHLLVDLTQSKDANGELIEFPTRIQVGIELKHVPKVIKALKGYTTQEKKDLIKCLRLEGGEKKPIRLRIVTSGGGEDDEKEQKSVKPPPAPKPKKREEEEKEKDDLPQKKHRENDLPQKKRKSPSSFSSSYLPMCQSHA